MIRKIIQPFFLFCKTQNFFSLLTLIYLSILIFVSIAASSISFIYRKQAFLTNADATYMQIKEQYSKTLDNFWQIYMPVIDDKSTVYNTLMEYFSSTPKAPLLVNETTDLNNALRQIMLRDNQVQWIALYSPYRSDNYILFNNADFPVIYSRETFPYIDNILSHNGLMDVFPLASITNQRNIISTFALCGNTPKCMNGGKIIAGYSTSPFEQICQNANFNLYSLTYTLTTYDELTDSLEIIFQSSPDSEKDLSYLPLKNAKGNIQDANNRNVYIRSNTCGNSQSFLNYEIAQWDLFLYAHRHTPLIILLVLAFALLSIFIYALMLRLIAKETNVIHSGLMKISQNQLSYRIPTNFHQNGFAAIARSINEMTAELNKNIEKAYYYELKQKDAELAELQSKFNPHFLYNSLEMLRSSCYQNGDAQTAELLTTLAGIFRGFISSKTFIPLAEELSFSRKYLALFNARYKDQVDIIFDIENECLQYGIIRNLFQPLIENYFVHGFNTSNTEKNYIYFRGKSLDESTLLFTVEDNGSGMSDEALKRINEKLNEPITLSSESYGLKNLQQRLQLFYDSDCGLTLSHNKAQGLSIKIKVRKLTCAEYETKKNRQAAE